MSGITPLLDTLLHQVLGRRAAQLQRAVLEQPIPPPQSGTASARAHSDSRLDPRPMLESGRSGAVTGSKVRGQTAAQAAAPSAPPEAAATSRFSRAARTIANILARFPAPPSAVRPSAPLLPGAPGNAQSLAQALRQSVQGSGLFYESHLRSWHHGSYPLAQLAREPQMQALRLALASRPSTSAAAPGGSPPASQPAAPAGSAPSPAASLEGLAPAMRGAVSVAGAGSALAPASAAVSMPPSGMTMTYGADGRPVAGPVLLPGDQTARLPLAEESAATTAADRLASLLGAQDKAASQLQGTVRHQLEMLATPVLRWEGQPWAGVFMALTLQPPASEAWHGQGDAESHDAGDSAWDTKLTLQLPNLGEVQVTLRLGARRLALDLQAQPETAQRLDAGVARLRERFDALGFAQVLLHVHARQDDHDR